MTRPAPTVTAVVPAAGASRRFGGAKLLADLAGRPLLDHTLRALLDGGVSRVVLVAAPAHDLGAIPAVADPRVSVVINPDPDRGMFSSIQAGLAAVPAAEAVLVLPADMPFVRPETVARLMAEHVTRRRTVVATRGGKRGHPLILSPDVWPSLTGLSADTTLKTALADAGVELLEVEVDDPGVLRDVDVRRDLE